MNLGSNLSAIMNMADAPDGKGGSYSAEEFAAAADILVNTLAQGTYISPTGKTLKVNGDLQKVRFSEAVLHNKLASKMVSSMQATGKLVEGTQEVRQEMRHDITAFRVFYGVPIMITFSPNQRQSLLMIKMSRLRKSDPFAKWDKDNLGEWGGLNDPELVESADIPLKIDDLIKKMPSSEEREKLMARDPLACTYGFRM